jgi:hypothetical protein
MPKLAHSSRWLVLVLCCSGSACPGCGPGGKLVPVTGRVTLDGVPLSGGTVVLAPEASGDGIRLAPSGTINEAGEYELRTAGRTGAPPGRYRATVVVAGDYQEREEGGVKKRQLPEGWAQQSPVDPRYAHPDTSPLVLDVVEDPAPGAYDLALSR